MLRRFGSTGIEVPRIGQGTWKMGAARDRKREVATLVRGLELGLTHLDTAELYGSEELVAEAVAASGRAREELFVVSKVLPHNASRKGTVAACEASLRRLGMEYLDCYLLHWESDEHPIRDTMAAMAELAAAGKIRSIGVSNLDVAELRAAEQALEAHGRRIVCNQVYYDLGERGIERRLVPYCESRDIAVVGYSPFGSGDFPEHPALARVAARLHATTRQVALAFLTRRAPLFTIPKASRVPHVEDNAGALGLVLGEEDVRELEGAFPVGPDGGGLATI